MPNINKSRDARRPISLRNGRGRRLGQNIETIITLTKKEHCFSGEILNIKHNHVKFTIDIIITIKFSNRK
jgi:hypothetical protein